MNPTLGEIIPALARRIRSDWPELDIEVILSHVLDKPRTWVLAHPEQRLDAQQAHSLESAIHQLELGEPLPYILGRWEFFGLGFEVNPQVLIPRPETELMVEKAITWLRLSSGRRNIADVGTGSGCIGIAIAVHIPDVQILATDLSLAALKVARRNARNHMVVDRLQLVQCDLLPLRSNRQSGGPLLDLICANLPYIPTRKLESLPVFGREPTLALNGGEAGLDLIQKLLKIAPSWLAPRGKLLLEIEASLGLKVVGLAYDAFSEAEIQLHPDLTGRDRLLEISLKD